MDTVLTLVAVGAVVCTECGKAIRTMEGALFQHVPDLEQWFGKEPR